MARERYLVNAGEDTIHDPEAEKKAEQSVKTPHGKWANFWYYHKLHVLIAVAVAVVAGYSIWSAVRTVQPDYTVGLITQQMYPQQVTDALEKGMEKYGKDLNHDGKVVIQITQYAIPSGSTSSAQATDAQAEMAYRTKLMADVSTGTSMIFLTDDASLRAQEKTGNHMFAYLDGSTPKDTAADYDKMRIAIAKCPKLANLTVDLQVGSKSTNARLSSLMKDVSMSLRIYYGSGIEGKQKDYYTASKELFQKLTT